MVSERYCVVDVETTGFSPARDRIVEVACAVVEGEELVGRWSSLVDPGMPIPPNATAVHGITDAMVAGAAPLDSALAQARRFCDGHVVAAHCAGFDLSFLGPSIGREALCTMRLARTLFPEAPNHRNQTLRYFLGVDRVVNEPLDPHRALSDAIVSAHVLIACRRRYRFSRREQAWSCFIRAHAMVALSAPNPQPGTAF